MSYRCWFPTWEGFSNSGLVPNGYIFQCNWNKVVAFCGALEFTGLLLLSHSEQHYCQFRVKNYVFIFLHKKCVTGQKQCVMSWPQPPFLFPQPLWQGGGRKFWSEFSLGRREGWLESVSRFGFVSHYPALIWLVINQTNFPKWTLFCPRR